MVRPGQSCQRLWAGLGEAQWSRAVGEYDISLMPGNRDIWEFKRDRRIRLPLADIGWSRDRVHYLRPEIQLLLKARGLRPKDQRDFEAPCPC